MADLPDLGLSLPLPRLRAVEAFPVEVEGEPMICLRDPEGVAAEPVMLSPGAFVIASLLDGETGAGRLAARAAEAFDGQAVNPDEVRSLVKQLDERGFLDTSSFRLQRAEARRRFAAQPVRESSHAGQAYPDDPAALRELIRSCFSAGNGPGWLEVSRPARPAPAGLIVPHVDYARGGPVYAWGHRRLAESELPELVVILGVAHAATEQPFALTRKSFATPLGAVETDLDAAREMESACGAWLLEEEYAHRGEHSIEFQLPWLQALHPGRAFRILPLLCGAFERFANGGDPGADPKIASVIGALAGIVSRRRALVLASVDLSHVGPRFGDDVAVDDALADAVRDADAALLSSLRSGDCRAFWASGTADGNARRVDALSAVYTLLAATGGPPGQVLAYGQGHDPAGGLVSFAAAVMEAPPG